MSVLLTQSHRPWASGEMGLEMDASREARCCHADEYIVVAAARSTRRARPTAELLRLRCYDFFFCCEYGCRPVVYLVRYHRGQSLLLAVSFGRQRCKLGVKRVSTILRFCILLESDQHHSSSSCWPWYKHIATVARTTIRAPRSATASVV